MSGTEAFVIDASVAIKWIIDEEGSAEADRLQGAEMAAPALLRIEAANVLRTLAARQQIDTAEAANLFALFQTAPVAIVDGDNRLERRALDLALGLGHPVYDCLYLALAERMQRRLVTADRRFLAALAGTEHAPRAASLSDIAAARPA